MILPSLTFVHQLVDQDFLRLEGVAAVHQGDVAGDVGQVQRFFDGGVAAADHGDVLVLVEEAVAGGAAGYALAHEGLLGRQAEVHGRGAGGDDQRVAGVGAGIADQGEGLFGQLGGVDLVEDDLGVEALGVALEAVHQLGALHAVDVGRPVVHVGGGHQLAALLHAGDDDRREVGARGIHGGANSRRGRNRG